MKLEDANHFEIGGNTDADDADISLTCLRCPDWHEWIAVSTEEDGPGVKLADLIQRAEQHTETCTAVYRGRVVEQSECWHGNTCPGGGPDCGPETP